VLDEEDFHDWCAQLGLTEEARVSVAAARSPNPSRRVGGGGRNVCGRYPSRKMGTTIQFESHRVELPFVYELEHDLHVLEYYDQPPSIPLYYHAANGRRLSVMHTPDFFVLRQDSAGWVECKTPEDLEKLAAKSPHRYLRDSDGNCHCIPGEAYALAMGLTYKVWSSAKVNWVLQRNLQFLEDYLRLASLDVTEVVNPAIKTVVESEPGIFLHELLERVRGGAEPDEIYLLLAAGCIYVDLRAAPIAEPDRVRVFANAEVAKALNLAHQVTSASPPICGDTGAPLTKTLNMQSRAFQLLAAASEPDLAAANRRFDLVKRRLSGEELLASVPARTMRLWVAQYRLAKEQYGNGYVGLLPQISKRGNRTHRLPDESRDLLIQFIENDYENLRQKTRVASWGALKRKCEVCGVVAPSYVTFCAAIQKRPAFEQTSKRQGRRAAYAHATFYFELERTTPRHGDRPFEIGHIDHTQLDVEVVCSRTGRPLGRPWTTIFTDAFSRRCLGLYLTFDEPSYRSCMMILRDCVRRHNRLPQTIVVDGGREFESTYFETLLARYECTKKTRPPAKARFGSVCERLFGTTNTQFVHNLRGNTQIMRHVRQVTKSNAPVGQAAWTLTCLYEYLSCFLFEVYDTTQHPALGQTPRQAYLAGFESSGARANRFIPYDQVFLIATLPTTQRGTAKIIPGRGVIINCVRYWAEAFRDPGVENQDVQVRYDPFDIGTAYAFVRNSWTECHSEHYVALQGRSEKEVMLASKEVRRRSQLHSRERFSLTARKLADFLESAEAEERCLLQRLRDRENSSVRQNNLMLNPGTACEQTTSWVSESESMTPPISSSSQAEATTIYGDF